VRVEAGVRWQDPRGGDIQHGIEITALHPRQQGALVDEVTPGGVDERGAGAEPFDPAGVDESPGDYGPVPALTGALLAMAQQGTLDPVLGAKGSFYNTDYKASILFLGDGTYFPGLADAQHLTGDQWGMMNETGNYPGQSWLWLFSALYQVEPLKSSPDADVLVVFSMVILTLLLTLVPFIPGLRSLPRRIPVHRLIWRDYYKHR